MTPKHPSTETLSLAHNPYADVNWARATQCRSQFHLHEPRNRIDPTSAAHDPPEGTGDDRSTPGDLVDKYQRAGYTAMAITEHEYYVDGTKFKGKPDAPDREVTTWPPDRWDRETPDSAMVPIQGAELRGTIAGVDRLHDIVSLGNGLAHGHERPLEAVASDVGERGGVSFLPHPGRYVDPDEIGPYLDLFGAVETVVGVEVFNANDRYPNGRAIWDALVGELGAQRPVWALANDDYHARPRPADQERFDQSRTVLLLEEQSRAGVLGALRNGRSYVQYDGEGAAPTIQSVAVDDGLVHLDATAATAVRWLSDGRVVGTGPEIALGEVPGGYVRAEATAAAGAVSCTQPLYLD
jgi:hypothetical protein